MAVLAGCRAGPTPERSDATTELPPPGAETTPSGRIYERNLVYMSEDLDSTLYVPWLFSSRSRTDGVERDLLAWLARGGVWDPFLEDHWSTPASRAPWRILPHGGVRLVVGMEDALEQIIYLEGDRELETTFGPMLIEWRGRRGQVFRLHESVAILSGRAWEGVVLDMTRARRIGDPEPGDWAFLVGGSQLQLVLEDPGLGRGFNAWARVDFRELQWQELAVEWVGTRPFEEARREVPTSWRFAAADGSVVGEMSVVSSDLAAGEGDGPVRSVSAWLEVEGTITFEGRDYPVRGLHRHLQP